MLKKSSVHNFEGAKKIIASFDDFMEGKKSDGQNEHLSSGSGNNTSFGPSDQGRELIKNSLKIDHSGAEENLSLSNVTVDSQAYAEDLIVRMLAEFDDKLLQKGGHPFHEFVFRCNWKDFNCKEGSVAYSFFTR